jgi:hypothetical protein
VKMEHRPGRLLAPDPWRRLERYNVQRETAVLALEPPRPADLGSMKPAEKVLVMKRIISVALVAMMSLVLAAPVSAGWGHGGGFHGGGVHHGGFHGRFHHGGFHRVGCCFGPAFVGGVFVGSAFAYPYDAYPYAAYPVYPDPVYAPTPAYQPQTQVSVAPSVSSGTSATPTVAINCKETG